MEKKKQTKDENFSHGRFQKVEWVGWGKEANLYCVIHHSSSSSEAHFFPVRPKKWIEWNEKKLNNHVWPVMEMRQG